MITERVSREYNRFIEDSDGRPAVRVINRGSSAGSAETTGSQDLATGSLSTTTALTGAFKIAYVSIHFSGAVSQTVTVTLDSAAGAAFDTVIDKVTLSSNTDYFLPGDKSTVFATGNQINVTCTNSGTPAVTASLVIATDGA